MGFGIGGLILIGILFLGSMGWTRDDAGIERILKNMSLEEKVGQVIFGFFRGPVLSSELEEMIRDYHLGGVILYSISGNVESPLQVASLVNAIQHVANKYDQIPLLVSIDQEGGLVERLTKGVTVFPGNMALGAVGNEKLAEKSAEITARELRILGITLNYAPVVDVNSNPANPVIGIRSFGSDPETVARLGTAMVKPYVQERVLCSAKHFPGHGDAGIDSQSGLPVIDRSRDELEKIELTPFKSMVQEGVPAVMTAHIVVPALNGNQDLPATLSPVVLQFLRKDMEYDGLILTDSMGMGAIDQRWGMEEAAILAFLAGADVLLFGADKGHEPAEQKGVHQALLEAVRSGRISQERLDQSVRRILKAKALVRVMDDPYPDFSKIDELALPENLQIAQEIADRSLTLIKNANQLLPVHIDVSFPVVWPKEYEKVLQILLTQCPNLKPFLLSLDPTDEEKNSLREHLKGTGIVVIGSYDLLRNTGWKELVQSVTNEKTILVAMRSPYDIMEIPNFGAAVATYGDRPVSVEALGRLLKGEIQPRGQLPVDLPGKYQRGWGMKGFEDEE